MFYTYEKWLSERYPNKRVFEGGELTDIPRQYQSEVLAYAVRCNSNIRIIGQYGTWAIDEEGLIHLLDGYWIEREQLLHDHWPLHMSGKKYVNMRDFLHAFYDARHYHYPEVFPSVRSIMVSVHHEARPRTPRSVNLAMRFRVMKRDGYRCQICGKSSADGVVLEVDHKIAIARGGDNSERNLWTLCFDCNRGKSASDL